MGSLALAEPSCDECLGAIDSLVARLPAGWAQVGQVLFPEFLQGAPICGDTGLCMQGKIVNCEDWEAAVAYIVELMNDAEEVAAAIDFLSGDALCAGDAQCASAIGALLPPAMQVLAAAFPETQAEICQDIAGVC